LAYEPLVQVGFAVEESGGGTLELAGVRAEALETDHGAVKLDLSLSVEARGGGLRATLSYARDLFAPADAERLLRCYQALLEGAARNPDRPAAELPVLSAAERHRALVEWSAGEPVPGPPAAIHRLVDEQAERTPEAVALAAGSGAVTYRELIRRSRALAARLRALGVGAEERVGLALGRGPDLVAALLGVLRCGGAYVPLDPAYPEERLAFMVEDAGIRVLLAERATAGRLAAAARTGARVVTLDEPGTAPAAEPGPEPAPEVPPDALAYVIYTSGSTGRPKGVAIAHRSASAMLRWAGRVFGADELSGLFAGTSVSFDLSVFELLVPLTRGGRVILGEDSLALAGLPGAAAVTLVNSVPSAIAELVRLDGLPPSLRTVNLAGEPLKRELVDRIQARPGVERVYNLYGPSEDTTYSTVELVPAGRPEEPAIGRPVAGTLALLLDRELQAVPAGVPGELLLAGAGLARGYLGRPARTAESFVPDPLAGRPGHAPGGRAYRTGDLARALPDGRLAFLGRIDHQVKLRGFRIELGEIETALAAHPGIAEAAVLLRRDGAGDGRLAAYVAPPAGGAAPGREELAAHLRRSLPAYMVPAVWVVLEALPLTANGKVDRRALAAVEPGAVAGPASRAGRAEPRSPEEEILAELWADLLGVEAVGVRQSFFELGGHSLLATRLVSRVRRLFGVEVPLRRMFETPTVAGLAALVVRGRRGAAPAAPPVVRVPRDRPLPASFAQERLWFLARLGEDGGSYNLPAALALRGALDAPALARALRAVVRRHEALRTVFAEGPADAGGVVQVVRPEVPAGLALVDLRGLPRERREAASRRAAEAAAGRPFDLARAPLVRFALVCRSADEHLLVVTCHHAVADGWSIGIVFRELAACYAGFRRGAAGPAVDLPELAVQYPDFAQWQRRWLTGELLAGQL
ncbi:MAG TPA: amino acid adenylation domain-containing protein, partial [Thermoanaerobaculia bacterium]|nr:amino acid adenylation domain-containing protein [Thermoanaerobaculia bacterium]